MLKLIRLVPLISRDRFPPVSKYYKQQLGGSMKYNIDFKDGNGIGYAIECYLLVDEINNDDNKPRRVCRIFEIESHSIQSGQSIIVLEDQLSPLIKTLISIEEMTKEVH